jgi:membrane protease YdiL (CAAX protease family)
MTTSVLTSDQTNSGSFLEKYQIPIVFLLVLGLTWPFMIWDALASHGILPFRLPLPVMLMQSYMPTLAAVIVTGLIAGRTGIRALFRKLLIARVGFRWYAFAVFGIAAICIAGILLGDRFGSASALPVLSNGMPPLSRPVELLLTIAVYFVLTGVLNGEELAWRGFALPRLQAKYNALVSSLILSVPFTLFHLPLFFDPAMNMGPFASFAIRAVALTTLFTWLYNHTRGSVLLAYIMHAAFNTWTRVFSIDPGNAFQDWMMTVVMVILAGIVVAVAGAENLSRTNSRITE